jgi:DNA-binding GntR family transcriptional regulator
MSVMSDRGRKFSAPRQPLPRRLTSDSVAEYISELIFRGEIRAHERIDRDEIAKAMGISRSPVQEALIRLEMDGFVRMEYHRGAYVAPFDTATVKEHFDIYGVLAGMASANAAKYASDEDVSRLRSILEEIDIAEHPEKQATLRGEFRVAVIRASSGQRLLMTMRSMNGLLGLLHGLAAPTPPVPTTDMLYKEFTAIQRHRPSAARSTAIKIVDLVAIEAIRQLTSRGVLDGPLSAPPRSSEPSHTRRSR